MTASGETGPVVTLSGVTKRFGDVVACRDVDVSVRAGEVLALVGENGAGKSTLVNMLCGLIAPDAGEIRLDGEAVSFRSPADAVAAGVGTVHQHFALVPTLSALDNIALGLPELGLGRLDRRGLAARVQAVADRLGFSVEDVPRVDGLDVAHQQRLEIVKALMHRVRVLILDEPTAVLGPEDRDGLFRTVRRLRAEGAGIVLITHKLDDVFAVADRVVVLRAGAVVLEAPVADVGARELVRAMVGTDDDALVSGIVDGRPPAAAVAPEGQVLGRVDRVGLRRANGSMAVSGVSFDLHAGEILAVAGVDGNGQSELVRCLAGMTRPDAGVIDLLGVRSDGRWTPGRLRAAGVAHVPEDRRRSGIVAGMTLARNYLLGHVDGPAFVRRGLIREKDLETAVSAGLSAYQVRSQGPRDLIERLSGGNQQKVVLARELDGTPRILLAAHPSRGLDIRTIRFVHERIEAARAAGLAVLLLSADLDEILRLADRVLVFAAGRAFGPTARAEVDRQRLGAWIAGHAEDAA